MEDITLKSIAEKYEIRGTAQWKPLGIEVTGFKTEEELAAGYTSEVAVGLEAGENHLKVGFDFYGRAAYNGKRIFSMSGGQRLSASIDDYYCAILGGARMGTVNRFHDESLTNPTHFSIEGGFEMGRRSENLMPGMSVGLFWNAKDQSLASTNVMLGYNW